MKSYLKINKFKAPFDISWLFKKDILKITKILTSKGADVYVVGGSVRNSYWQEEFDNIDFSSFLVLHHLCCGRHETSFVVPWEPPGRSKCHLLSCSLQ